MKRMRHTLGAAALLLVFSIGARRVSPPYLSEAQSMYLHDSTLYVSDLYDGIHVYAAPPGNALTYRTTIPLSGNAGVAVRDDIIYANSWESILALRLYADNTCDTAALIRQGPSYIPMYDDIEYSRGWGCHSVVYDEATPTSGGSGQGSSYAVFGVIDTFLYYVDGYSIITMSVAQADSPVVLSTTTISWDLETLFPTENFLFVGASTGMYVLDRVSDPTNPRYIGMFSHAQGCDPVVVHDTVAFVTLRGGNTCGAVNDAFLSVSVGDATAPYLLDEVNPRTPYGLAVQDTLVYVAKGYNGFALYSAAQPSALQIVATWPSDIAKDFIWYGDMLYVMTFGAVKVYDVRDPRNPIALGADS